MAKKPAYDIRDIRCTGCGRFLGKGDVQQGFMLIYCPKCHDWTATIGPSDEKVLTTKVLSDIVSDSRTQGHKVR